MLSVNDRHKAIVLHLLRPQCIADVAARDPRETRFRLPF